MQPTAEATAPAKTKCPDEASADAAHERHDAAQQAHGQGRLAPTIVLLVTMVLLLPVLILAFATVATAWQCVTPARTAAEDAMVAKPTRRRRGSGASAEAAAAAQKSGDYGAITIVGVGLRTVGKAMALTAAEGVCSYWRASVARGDAVAVIAVTEIHKLAMETFARVVEERSEGQLRVYYGPEGEGAMTMDSDGAHHQGRGANAVVCDTARVELTGIRWEELREDGVGQEGNRLRFPLCALRTKDSEPREFSVMPVHCTPAKKHKLLVAMVAAAVSRERLSVAIGDFNFQYFGPMSAEEVVLVPEVDYLTTARRGGELRADAMGCVATRGLVERCQWEEHGIAPSDHRHACVARLTLDPTRDAPPPVVASARAAVTTEVTVAAVSACDALEVAASGVAVGAMNVVRTAGGAIPQPADEGEQRRRDVARGAEPVAARVREDGEAEFERHLAALASLHYATLQALCKRGGAPTPSTRGLDFSVLQLRGDEWLACLSGGTGCKARMVEQIRVAARARRGSCG